MKKKIMTLISLTALLAVLITSCAPPRQMAPPPHPPGAPGPGR